MLKLYYADVSALDIDRCPPLSQYRRERLDAVKPIMARRAGAGAELLLYRALKECAPQLALPPEIIIGERGKPALSGGEVFFSLSHYGGYAAAAVCDEEVGVDIQAISEYNPALARRFFALDEQDYIEQSADKNEAFTQIWCMKESYIKAVGTGLYTPLESFSVLEMPFIKAFLREGNMLAVCVPSRKEINIDSIEKTELCL